ncbi:MAG TPA: alpha-L-fucosidase [Saprospiraceae bacterium]|nr:alpha-L-fucosidase [Saprospiraceae bacterium]HNT19806.1 alpha-L-fucosidase [Saprospiraceae bacterium]
MYGLLKNSILFLFFLLVLSACRFGNEETRFANLILIDSTDDHGDILFKAAHVIPTPRQLEWQKLEMTAFLHFGVNTFTDNEWGDGQEDPKIFLPTNLDANQWVSVLKEAGFRLVILTAKHHDGFCLWPSAFTSHSVKNSLWKNGQGDVVKELADACVRQNMKLGLYLSPWDRHEPTYGSEAYNDYYKRQLRELLTNYGPVDEVWFDGAVGEGPNGKKQVYDWQGYFRLVRELQPQAVIAIMGPDVRWVGTESGYGRETEWSVIPIQDSIPVTADDLHDNMVKPVLDETREEIANLEQLGVAGAMKWYPSEVDVSIRPGWFYHASEDRLVKSPEKLLDIYFNSVGKNSVLLLNIPPDRQGLIPEKDATILKVFSNSLRQIFSNDLARAARADDNDFTISHLPKNTNDGHRDTYWSPDEGNAAPFISFEWQKPVWFNILKICEQIELGQRVAGFQLEILEDGQWIKKASGTTVGYTRLLRFPWVRTQKARIIFTDFRNTVNISEIGFYQNMPEVTLTPPGKPFEDSLVVTMSTNDPEANIYYSQNYSLPSVASNLYTGPVKLNHSSPILAIAINPDGLSGFIRDEVYSKAKYKARLLTTPSPQYMSEGALVLCDGLKGDLDFKSKKWLGYENQDLETIFDLGQSRPVNSILIHSLSLVKKGIFPPLQVSIYGSGDGENFQLIKTKVENFEAHPEDGLVTWAVPRIDRRLRFVKIVVSNRLPADDDPVNGFLFVSEIEII